jgi:hypothetical protein
MQPFGFLELEVLASEYEHQRTFETQWALCQQWQLANEFTQCAHQNDPTRTRVTLPVLRVKGR